MSKKVLFIAPEIMNMERLRVGFEARQISIRLPKDFITKYFYVTPDMITNDIFNKVKEKKIEVIHISAHTDDNGKICINDEKGFHHPLEIQALSNFFRLTNERQDIIECVVLNICNSEDYAKDISNYVKYVIGMREPIRDEAAISFSQGFYSTLTEENDFINSYKCGCNQILQDGYLSEELLPQLKERSKTSFFYNKYIALLDLSDPETSIRIRAARWLGATRQDFAVDRLIETFNNEYDPEVKYWIIISVGQIGCMRSRAFIDQLTNKLKFESDQLIIEYYKEALSFSKMIE